jgi:general secretion pathway protein E
VDDDIRELLLQDKDAATIKKAAVKSGMQSLRSAGLSTALQGITTLDEIMRVTQEEV